MGVRGWTEEQRQVAAILGEHTTGRAPGSERTSAWLWAGAISLLLHMATPAAAREGEANEPAKPAGPPGRVLAIEEAEGRDLARFRAALLRAAAGEGKARVLHFGDSHVAADLWTMYLRHGLQRAFGDAGPGFVGWGRSPRRYAHRDLRLTRSRRWGSEWVREKEWRDDGCYGLDGVVATSRHAGQWLRLQTGRRGTFGRRFERLEVFYLEQPGGAALRLVVDGRTQKRLKTRARAKGLGRISLELPDRPHRVDLRQRSRGRLSVLGAVAERSGPGVVYDSLGVNGARMSAWLHWDEALLTAQASQRRPDLVILSYGTNEAGDRNDPLEEYEQRLEEALQRARRVTGGCDCLLTGPSDVAILERPTGFVLPEPRVADVRAVQRRVASRQGCAYWDTQAAMGGPLTVIDWRAHSPALAGRDLVHLTARGYERLADLLLVALVWPLLPHP